MILRALLFALLLTSGAFCISPIAHSLEAHESHHLNRSVFGAGAPEILVAHRPCAQYIEQRTEEIRRELLDADQVLEVEGLVPANFDPPILRDSTTHLYFEKKGLAPVCKILSRLDELGALEDSAHTLQEGLQPENAPRLQHLSTSPRPRRKVSLPGVTANLHHKHDLLTALLVISDVQTHTGLKVMFRLDDTPETNMLDSILSTSLGALVITLPKRNWHQRRSWQTHKKFIEPESIIKERVGKQINALLNVEQTAQILLKHAPSSLLSSIAQQISPFALWSSMCQKVRNYFGFSPDPFEQSSNQPFLQTYAQHLLWHLIQTRSHTPVLEQQEEHIQNALWKIVTIFHVSQVAPPVFPNPLISLPASALLESLPITLKGSIRTHFLSHITDTSRNPDALMPPPTHAHEKTQQCQKVWLGYPSTTSTHVSVNTLLAILSTIEKLACLDPTSPGTAELTQSIYIYCALSDNPICTLQEGKKGIMVGLPTPQAVRRITNLPEYIDLASSLQAVIYATTNYRYDVFTIQTLFNERYQLLRNQGYLRLGSAWSNDLYQFPTNQDHILLEDMAQRFRSPTHPM